MQTRRFLFLSAIAAAILVTTLLFGIAVFYSLGPRLETRFNPVYRQVIVTQIKREKESVQFIVSGFKARACTFIGIDVLTYRKDRWIPTSIIQDPNFPLITTPTGHQILGSFWINPAGTKIVFETRHFCHGLWTTVTRGPEIEVKQSLTTDL